MPPQAGPVAYVTLREPASSDAAVPARGASRPLVQAFAPLSPAEHQHLAARIPPLEAAGLNGAPFALREATPPPPSTSEAAPEPFPPSPPPAGGPPASGGGQRLEVVRCSPQGEVGLAPHLSITFSHPMVPITSVAALQEGAVPVQLEPCPEGRWRWVGDRTLLFEPTYRFAQATAHAVQVPPWPQPPQLLQPPPTPTASTVPVFCLFDCSLPPKVVLLGTYLCCGTRFLAGLTSLFLVPPLSLYLFAAGYGWVGWV